MARVRRIGAGAVAAACVLCLGALASHLSAGTSGRRGGPERAAPPATSAADGIRRVATQEKAVALTLDDGPDPTYTPLVLDLARERRIALTFFVTGEHVRRYPRLVRRIHAEGHAIGNHTWSHEPMLGMSEAEDLAQMQACAVEIKEVCGDQPRLFRPPKGKLDENVVRAAASLGYTVVLWSIAVESHDASTPQQMAERVVKKVQPGSIILAHDGRRYERVSRDKTMAALPLLVEALQEQGYRFVTVPELLALGARGPDASGKPESAQRAHGRGSAT
ncbi:MAG: polysaccharide deacetylase family protein [Armatimonadota bacterium]